MPCSLNVQRLVSWNAFALLVVPLHLSSDFGISHDTRGVLQLLGISMPAKEIEAILHEVDRSGTGELEMDDFTQLMVLTLSRRANQAGEHAKGEDTEEKGSHAMQQASLPFEVVALAYRRYGLQARMDPFCGLRGADMPLSSFSNAASHGRNVAGVLSLPYGAERS